MTEVEQQLLQYLKERSLRFGEFRLASGRTSNYYIDGKMSEVFSRSARLIGEVIYERTKDLPIDAIGGLEVGAVPLTTAAVIAYDLHGRTMEGFWARAEVKSHGTQKQIEGKLAPGSRVAILDDVVTSGGSSVKAIEAVRTIGCEVVVVLTLVDRLAGAAELLAQHGVKDYRPIFTIRDLGVSPDPAPPFPLNAFPIVDSRNGPRHWRRVLHPHSRQECRNRLGGAMAPCHGRDAAGAAR